jgi:hypothetical protein
LLDRRAVGPGAKFRKSAGMRPRSDDTLGELLDIEKRNQYAISAINHLAYWRRVGPDHQAASAQASTGHNPVWQTQHIRHRDSTYCGSSVAKSPDHTLILRSRGEVSHCCNGNIGPTAV